MKKSFTFFLFILSWLNLSAQIQAGDNILGGQINLDFNASEDKLGDTSSLESQNLGFGLNPSFAFMVNKNWAVGGFLSYHHNVNTREGLYGSSQITENKNISNSYGGGLFAQRYFRLGSALFFRTKFSTSMNYRASRRLDPYYNQDDKTIFRNLFVSFSPAFSYFVTPHLALTADWSALQYAYYVRGDSEFISHSVEFNLNVSSIGFGLEWFF